MEAAPHPWPALGVLLMRDGLVEKGELEDILNEHRQNYPELPFLSGLKQTRFALFLKDYLLFIKNLPIA